MIPPSGRPPVIVLGGGSNTLSIGRSLGARGVEVYTVGSAPYLKHSRYLRPIPIDSRGDEERAWADCLLGPRTEHLRGAVVLAANDTGISVLINHRELMQDRYLLDVCNVQAQMDMLDKLATYQRAVAAAVPTPRFWPLNSPADLKHHLDELVFPLIVKPRHSHAYKAVFPGGSKFRVVADVGGLRTAVQDLTEAGVAILLVEKIVGPDDLLCSYNTYIDASGSTTFDFTKRILRRYPPNEGIASYHLTDWNPDVREVALRLFSHVGLRGVANAEFKLDRRDGLLKLIECNARFTNSACLLAACGMDQAEHVYRQIIGRPTPMPQHYATGRRLLSFSNDVRAFRALHRTGDLTFPAYARSLMHRQTFGYFSTSDPGPALARGAMRIGKLMGRAHDTTPVPRRGIPTEDRAPK